MSGSYDRPPRQPPSRSADLEPLERSASMSAGEARAQSHAQSRAPAQGLGRADSFSTGLDYVPEIDPAAEFEVEPVTEPRHRRSPDLYAEARDTPTSRRGRHEPPRAPIVPAGSVTGRSLTVVVSIMCFLACLTSGAVYMMNQNASAWLRNIASEITVQVEPRDKVDVERTVREVVELLQKQPGIRAAKAKSVAQSTEGLKQWLPRIDELQWLPVSRLIAVEIDPTTRPDIEAIKRQLEQQYKGVTLDDHRKWMAGIRTVTRSFALGGIAILFLVGAATTAIIVSATRSSMASNREIVEVLHFVGATDRFIAGEFQSHFLRLGIRAGIVGALPAAAMFFVMPLVMDLLGGGTLTVSELRRFIGSGSLDIGGYLVLLAVVVVIAALCMITSRLGVFRILHSRQ